MSRRCSSCRCADDHACIEFDDRGVAHACYWVSADLCSACAFRDWVEPPSFDEGADTRVRFKGRIISAPGLAGMVARPRS